MQIALQIILLLMKHNRHRRSDDLKASIISTGFKFILD